MKADSRLRGWLKGLAATLVWGCIYSVGRFVFGAGGEAADPYLMAMYKFALGALALAPMLCRDGGWREAARAVRGDFPLMLLLVLFGNILEGGLQLYAGKYTTAARCSLLCNLSPVFTVLCMAAFTRRLPGRWKLVGMAAGFAGVLILLRSPGQDAYTQGGSTLAGDLMALVSGCSWAVFTVLSGRYASRYDSIAVTFVMLAGAALALLPVCLLRGTPLFPALPWSVWGGVAFIGILASGLGIVWWNQALQTVPADSLGAFGYLSAAIAMVLAWTTTGERFQWRFFAALALIAAALLLMNRRDNAEKCHLTK